MVNLDFHIVKCIKEQVSLGGNRIALRHKVDNEWQGISWNEFGQQIDQVSLALLSFGLGIQDKIGIFSSNMPKWTIADFAALQARLVTVPIYPTNTPDQSAYILQNADVKILFVGDQPQYDAALSIFEQCEQLQLIVVMNDQVDLKGFVHAFSWEDFIAQGSALQEAELTARLAAANYDDLYTLIYTSGTTGQPKGVMIDYRNIGAQLEGHDQRLSLYFDNRS